jgi:hypothetical protein
MRVTDPDIEFQNPASPARPSGSGLSYHKSRNRRRADVVVRPISVGARCSESHSRFSTLKQMGQAHQRIMLVGSPRTRSARRRRGLSLASCHCGAVTLSVDAELPTKAVSRIVTVTGSSLVPGGG